MSSVGIKEIAGDIDNCLSPPMHDKSRGLRDCGHDDRFEIFLMGIFHELLCVLLIDNNSHSLLRLGDGNFRAVETGIFLRDLVKINIKSSCELADCNRYTAGTEVVALLDQVGGIRPPEESLQFALCRRVALLDLSAAYQCGFFCVYL